MQTARPPDAHVHMLQPEEAIRYPGMVTYSLLSNMRGISAYRKAIGQTNCPSRSR